MEVVCGEISALYIVLPFQIMNVHLSVVFNSSLRASPHKTLVFLFGCFSMFDDMSSWYAILLSYFWVEINHLSSLLVQFLLQEALLLVYTVSEAFPAKLDLMVKLCLDHWASSWVFYSSFQPTLQVGWVMLQSHNWESESLSWLFCFSFTQPYQGSG